MDELRYSLLYTTVELETTRQDAQEEIKRKEDQVIHLKDLLNRTMKERDEAQECQRLLMEKLFLLQQQPSSQLTTTLSGISGFEDETRRGDSISGISSSDCEESIVSSPMVDPTLPPPLQAQPSTALTPTLRQLASEKQLPENGKFLQAVMNAGPLLQTLLLAGPLPQWRYPPPQINSIEIPPVAIPSAARPSHLLRQDSSTFTASSDNNNGCCLSQKRPLIVFEGSDSSNNTKYQRIALH
ncbi:Enabled-like protein [Thalictrum thalictroides]|uniref:Enabled-like protein n=1 Tax=Thalictrum thalictroides TaxID=46969 RepID=A0A7J6X5F2_THATH|nr:Enabled-like protein [Thalictrum thalictroides]